MSAERRRRVLERLVTCTARRPPATVETPLTGSCLRNSVPKQPVQNRPQSCEQWKSTEATIKNVASAPENSCAICGEYFEDRDLLREHVQAELALCLDTASPPRASQALEAPNSGRTRRELPTDQAGADCSRATRLAIKGGQENPLLSTGASALSPSKNLPSTVPAQYGQLITGLSQRVAPQRTPPRPVQSSRGVRIEKKMVVLGGKISRSRSNGAAASWQQHVGGRSIAKQAYKHSRYTPYSVPPIFNHFAGSFDDAAAEGRVTWEGVGQLSYGAGLDGSDM
ncbi:hypothetical protein CYMTET_37999 [Cymbomonas tetramitiformis]|uniref:C2H2-type domain-containing protein n=1 Tax=Cymbomonas tetramitiformis TaxID=36881 RepID=A0AAE0CCU6_9CHLO|nr:hypothetical protein CYMTET_37999 [Cymbomonas tetramitiformis]